QFPQASRPASDAKNPVALSDDHHLDYPAAQVSASPDITYEGALGALGIHDVSAAGYLQDINSASTQSLGTTQTPKSTGQKPKPSVSPPNNYLVKKEIEAELML